MVIKAVQEAEIKRNVDNALAIKKQQMTSDHENVKRQLIVEHNKLNQAIKTELESLKKSNQATWVQYDDLNRKYSRRFHSGRNEIMCPSCGRDNNECYTQTSSYTTCRIRGITIDNYTGNKVV